MGHITREQVEAYMPQDKSWVIRMGILDLTRGYQNDIISFLDSQDQSSLGGDFKAFRRVAENWSSRNSRPLDVGESGTIYRFIKFYNWMHNIPFDPLTSGTLVERSKTEITSDPKIITYTPEQLLTLDHNTTQWATMQYLLSPQDLRRKVDPKFNQGKKVSRSADFKLRLTYDAVGHWEDQRTQGKVWQSKIDSTFFNQAISFIESLKTGVMCYSGEQAEDYCFERAFGILSESEGRLVYPSVEGHETKRFGEMERLIQDADRTGKIESKDHRAVQAMVMRQIFLNRPFTVTNPESVNKTWPNFWDFIKYVKENID